MNVEFDTDLSFSKDIFSSAVHKSKISQEVADMCFERLEDMWEDIFVEAEWYINLINKEVFIRGESAIKYLENYCSDEPYEIFVELGIGPEDMEDDEDLGTEGEAIFAFWEVVPRILLDFGLDSLRFLKNDLKRGYRQ